MSTPHARSQPSQNQNNRSYRLIFLWAVGLNVLNDLWLHIRGRGPKQEPKKPIIQKSRWKALQRCAVHILPATISLLLVPLHMKHYYMGKELNGVPNSTSLYMALLQVAAKTQELLIVASLATVIVHQLRSDLLSGPGVPFGLIGATSQFSQMSFFWSSTFFGALPGKWRLHANAKLLTLTIVSGIVAATVGPAVAILLLPRQHVWEAGGSTFWVNGTFDDHFPKIVGLEHYMPDVDAGPGKENCTGLYAYTNPFCPAGGYPALVHQISSGYISPRSRDVGDELYTQDYLGNAYSTTVTSAPMNEEMRPYTLLYTKLGDLAMQSSAIAVYGPAAWIAHKLGEDWNVAARAAKYDIRSQIMRYKYWSTARSLVNTSLPAVRVVCSLPKLLDRSQDVVEFPWMPEYESATEFIDGDERRVRIRRLESVKIEDDSLRNRSFTDFLRISRVDLARLTWTDASTGVLMEYPWENATSRYVSGCVIDARWVKGAVSHHSNSGDPSIPTLGQDSTLPLTSTDSYAERDLFRPSTGGLWTRIDITAALFNAINFPLPSTLSVPAYGSPSSPQPNNVTSIEALLMSTLLRDAPASDASTSNVAHTISMIFADALARVGSWRLPHQEPMSSKVIDWEAQILNGAYGGSSYNGPPAGSHDRVTYFQMKQSITGFAYKASTTTDYLALSVVIIHLVIAVGHTVLLLTRKESSGCWDTLPELLALAQQSAPSTTVLKNTSTGIYRLNSFRNTVRVLISRDDEEHVELRFDKDNVGDDLRRPIVSRKYG